MMKHLRLDKVGQVARGTAKTGNRLYEVPPLTFRVGPSLCPVPPRRVGGGISSLSTMSDFSSEEVWKPVPGYEGLYEVSSFGRVRSKDREVKTKAGWSKHVKGKVLSPCQCGSDYYSVELYHDGEGERFYIHRLVARVFIGEPEEDLVVNHKDHDPRNNSVGNLEWVTQAENLRDARENTGANPSGVDAYRAKLTHREVAEIKYLLSNTDLPQYEIAEEYEVQQSTISEINTGDRHSEVEQIRRDEDVRELDITFRNEDKIHA